MIWRKVTVGIASVTLVLTSAGIALAGGLTPTSFQLLIGSKPASLTILFDDGNWRSSPSPLRCQSWPAGSCSASGPAAGATTHKVRGLESGADDYITKPFGVEELLARVRAVLRRRSWDAQVAAPTPLAHGEVRLDPQCHRVQVNSRDIDLTPAEFRLLHLLMANAGRVLVPREALRRVWGPEYEDQTEILRTTVRRLRQKVEDDPARPTRVRTIRGIGYSFAG